MVQEQKRLDYLDIAKALALLLVIYGHTFRDSMRADYVWCNLSYIFVYRFHVSLLFLVSGMGYALSGKKNQSLSVSQYLKKKAHSLLLPWFSYSVIIYLIFVFAQLIPFSRALLSSSSYQIISPIQYGIAMLRNENPYSFHLWYLQTLFLFVFVTFLLDHFLSVQIARNVKLILFLFTPIFYILFCNSWVWILKGFFQKYFFFLLGTLLPSQVLERRPHLFVRLGALSCLYMLLELFYPSMDSLYSSRLIGLPLSYLDNIVIIGLCLGILALCILLQKKLQWAAKFGKDTMLYYLYHQPFCCAVLGMILYDKLHIPAFATVFLCATASLCFPQLFRVVIRRLRMCKILENLGLPI